MKQIFLLGFILLFRIIPHPPDFTPVFAFMAFILTRSVFFHAESFSKECSKNCACFFLAWFISDLILGYRFGSWSVITYMSLLMTSVTLMALGTISALKKLKFFDGFNLVSTLSTATVYWSYSNLGVWMLEGIYPHSINGLTACYALAVPFLMNTWAGTLLGYFGIQIYLQLLKKGNRYGYQNSVIDARSIKYHQG